MGFFKTLKNPAVKEAPPPADSFSDSHKNPPPQPKPRSSKRAAETQPKGANPEKRLRKDETVAANHSAGSVPETAEVKWAVEDQLVILKGILDFRASKGSEAPRNNQEILDSIRDALSVQGVTPAQLSRKILYLKQCYKKLKRRDKMSMSQLDRHVLEMADKLWGDKAVDDKESNVSDLAKREKKSRRGNKVEWADEDQLVILKGMLDYRAHNGPHTQFNRGEFLDSIRGGLSVQGVTRQQLTRKMTWLKERYTKLKEWNGLFMSQLDRRVLELGEKLWGDRAHDSNVVGEFSKNKRWKWGNEDELVILRGILDYRANKGCNAVRLNYQEILDSIRDSLSVEGVTKKKLANKIWFIKERYEKLKKENKMGMSQLDRSVLEMADKIWGDDRDSVKDKKAGGKKIDKKAKDKGEGVVVEDSVEVKEESAEERKVKEERWKAEECNGVERDWEEEFEFVFELDEFPEINEAIIKAAMKRMDEGERNEISKKLSKAKAVAMEVYMLKMEALELAMKKNLEDTEMDCA